MPAYVTSITLGHFRNHTALTLDTDASAIVITGRNGAGKTNILEALSLFSVGRGFRHASVQEQLQDAQPPAHFWRVQATLQQSDGAQDILLTAYDITAGARRIIKINEISIKKQAELLDYLTVLWFLPTQSHLFLAGMSERRKYLDRIVYSLDAQHATRVHAYEHYVRERKKIIEQPSYDAGWLEVIEEKIAQYAIEIAVIRAKVATQLTAACAHIHPLFPHFSLQLVGELEDLLHQGADAMQVRQVLRSRRVQDARAGRASFGAHKSQFHVYFAGNISRPAESCSTGEQKALLLAMLVAQITLLQSQSRPILLLLDEMVAHLDAQRRDALFALVQGSPIQLFATGTDVADFNTLRDALHIVL